MARISVALPALCLAALPIPVLAQNETPVPQIFSDLLACRAITEDSARLACFDRHMAAMQTATENESIMVVDQSEVQEAGRDLFGLRHSESRLFGGTGENRVEEIETTIVAVSGGGRRQGWTFRLENGSVWHQTDNRQMSRDPRPGHSISIRRAALGSFLAKVDGMRSIRVRRAE